MRENIARFNPVVHFLSSTYSILRIASARKGISLTAIVQTPVNVFFAFMNLLRLRIVVMVLVTYSIGFILAYHGQFCFSSFFYALIGIACLSGGACALNCYIERDLDALMPRTSGRPIPAGEISPGSALLFGTVLILAGCILLFSKVNTLSGLLGFFAAFIYLMLYTPAKRLTWLNTSIGALPGAIPPMIGWAVARGQIESGGWILFAMLFLWQHTHFFPIAWLYKGDYQKGGFKMLPVLESNGKKTFFLTILSAITLLPVSMLLYFLSGAGFAYCLGSLICGLLLIAAAIRWSRHPSREHARAILLLSVIYLPVIFIAVVLDRYGAQMGSYFHEYLGILLRWI